MISQICFDIKNKEIKLLDSIVNSVARNFGGNNNEEVMKKLYNEFSDLGGE